MDKAVEVLADMRGSGVSPDKVTYSTLIKGHCFSGNIDAAFAVLQEMRDTDGLAPDEVIYNSLLDGCVKEHRLQEAMDLFALMRAEGLRPNVQVYTRLTTACMDNGQLDKALQQRK